MRRRRGCDEGGDENVEVWSVFFYRIKFIRIYSHIIAPQLFARTLQNGLRQFSHIVRRLPEGVDEFPPQVIAFHFYFIFISFKKKKRDTFIHNNGYRNTHTITISSSFTHNNRLRNTHTQSPSHLHSPSNLHSSSHLLIYSIMHTQSSSHLHSLYKISAHTITNSSSFTISSSSFTL